jgi:hypothetical protein
MYAPHLNGHLNDRSVPIGLRTDLGAQIKASRAVPHDLTEQIGGVGPISSVRLGSCQVRESG